MENYILKKPITFDGEEITEINMDLDDLSRIDLENCEKQARRLAGKKRLVGLVEFNKDYLACVAAKAAGLKIDAVRSFSGKDYTQICLLVQDFLLDGESDEDQGDEDQTLTFGKPLPKTPKTPMTPIAAPLSSTASEEK